MSKILATLMVGVLLGGGTVYVFKVQADEKRRKTASDAWQQGEREKAEMYKKIDQMTKDGSIMK